MTGTHSSGAPDRVFDHCGQPYEAQVKLDAATLVHPFLRRFRLAIPSQVWRPTGWEGQR